MYDKVGIIQSQAYGRGVLEAIRLSMSADEPERSLWAHRAAYRARYAVHLYHLATGAKQQQQEVGG